MSYLKRYWYFVLLGVLILFLLISAPPLAFPQNITVVVERGTSVQAVAEELVEKKVLAHPTTFALVLRIFGEKGTIQAGAYRFSNSQNAFTLAYRLHAGDYGLPPVKITFFEGTTVRDYAAQLESALPGITADNFIRKARDDEGYLFPDTYTFPPGSDTQYVIDTMRANFDEKIKPLQAEIASSSRSLSDIVTLASIIEKEARTTETRRMIAGILFNRLKKNMPLQVDAVFGYIFGRDTYSPSYADLKVDSAYNTYTHKGLPPGPIDNPSLDSIEAVLNPTKSNYLYYLVDKQGITHYAATFAEHQANEQKYLR